MERSGFENNDFSGGLSDEYVPTKDNRLDACENICLDDDLSIIQRPGSSYLEGADTSTYGKHASQAKAQGIFETSKGLYQFSGNKAFLYTPPQFNLLTSTQPDMFYEQMVDQIFGSTQPPLVPVTGGSVNGFVARDIVYATNSKLAFPIKAFVADGDPTIPTPNTQYVMGVGLPKLPDMHNVVDGSFVQMPSCYVSLQKARYTIASTIPFSPDGETYPVACNTTTLTSFINPQATDTWGWSDKPYTYKNGAVVKSTWAFRYQFSLCLKMTYKIDGVTYVKRSAPTTPTYFLSDTNFTTTETTQTNLGVTTTTRETYLIGVTYNKDLLVPLMRAMNLPVLAQTDADMEVAAPFFELEFYMTEANQAELYKRPTKTGVDWRNTSPYYQKNNTVILGHNRINNNLSSTLQNLGGGLPQHFPDGTPSQNACLQPDLLCNHQFSVIEEKQILYTSGGVLPYDPPPLCKYMFRAGTYAFYLNISEETITYASKSGDVSYRSYKQVPYRLKISNANDPESVPEGNLVDLPDPIMGGADILDRAIVGTTKEIYRIDGRFDSTGSGLVNGQVLSSETGVLSHKSMVAVKDRLFFCGDDGIYMTDGIGVICISRHISRTYRKLIEAVASDSFGNVINIDREACQEKISAIYDRVYDRIIFSFGAKALALELKASVLEDGHGSFFGPWFIGVNPTTPDIGFAALGTYKDRVVRGDEFGYVLQTSPGYTSDPQVGLFSPVAMKRHPVIYRLRTTKYAFGSLVVKKWVNLVTFVLKRRKVLDGGHTEIDVQVHGYNDGERSRQVLKPAHYNGERDNIYDASPKYAGVSVPKVLTDTLVNFQRRFGSAAMRCLTKAIEFTNGYNVVGKSDDQGLASVASNTVTLVNFPTQQWPKESQDLDQTGYYIAFDADNYTQKFLVTGVSGANLFLSTNTGLTNTYKWKLYSFSTKQFFGLHSLGIVYTTFASKHSSYHNDAQGGNVGDRGE